MFNMPILYFMILSVIFATVGIISVVMAFHYSKKAQTAVIKTETETVEITATKSPNKVKQAENAVSLFKISALILFAISIILLSVFIYYDTTARKYGAYDDYYKVESINDIKHNISLGFIDQSEELPEDLSGCIIIYVKYGCIDCDEIHDGITSYLNEKETNNIYFVSTRSEKGQKLLEQYPVTAVPTGIYILNEPIGDTTMYYEVLYDIYAAESETDTFLPESMDQLLAYQKNQL